jgi:pimeloyl-ACP methyl ester carboxylesterase
MPPHMTVSTEKMIAAADAEICTEAFGQPGDPRVLHGRALAEAVPGAKLVTLDGGGHELHEGDWDQILDAILSHTTARRSP